MDSVRLIEGSLLPAIRRTRPDGSPVIRSVAASVSLSEGLPFGRFHVVQERMVGAPTIRPATDAELLSAVARKDRDAYAAVYERYGRILLGLLMRILDDRAEAEEVLQDVFLQVWRRAADYDDSRGRPFVWLTTLARSRALDRIDALRSRQRTAAGAGSAIRESAPDPAELASEAEDGRRLRRALAEIPAAQREVLLLGYFEGLSQSEIAARLDAPLGTVKSHARLGLTKLRALLRLGDPTREGRR
jgi:RNA polymerase sigma-70 factor, ECF subfamily